MNRLFCAATLAAIVLGLGCGGSSDPSRPKHGVAVFNGGWIGIVDADKRSVQTSFLSGEFGASTGDLFDAVVSPDGKTAIVSSFGAMKVHFIDLSRPSIPRHQGSLELSFFAEDIDVTPDGRFALVTDGGFSTKVAVIDVQKRTLVEEYNSNPTPDTPPVQKARPDTARTSEALMDTVAPACFNAVAVAKDGKTVLGVDYSGCKIHVLTLDAKGHLTYVKAIDMPTAVDGNGNTFSTLRPINVTISPNGKTALVACGAANNSVTWMAFPVLQISAPGQVALSQLATSSTHLTAAQSIAFNPSGMKAYAFCTQENPTNLLPDDPAYPRNVIVELNIQDPGVAACGRVFPTDFVGSSQLFGVDTVAMDPEGRYLYVGNMTLSGAKKQIQILDAAKGTWVKTLSFPAVTVPPTTAGGSATEEDAYPTAIAFARH
jgi:DNA-binding beta-propeller fold protein YncE